MKLPAPARSRLNALAQAVADADMQRRSAIDAVRDLERDIPRAKAGEFADDDAARSVADLERDLEDARFALQCRDEAHRHVRAVLNVVEDWMLRNAHIQLEPVELPALKLKAGDTVSKVLERTREQIEELHVQLRSAQGAPPLASELKAGVPAIVAGLAAKARPKLRVEDGALVVDWRAPSTLVANKDRAGALWHVELMAGARPLTCGASSQCG